MEILLNGKGHSLEQGTNVSDLLCDLKVEGKIAVEINQHIIPKSQHDVTIIEEGDRIEIVNAIGGG